MVKGTAKMKVSTGPPQLSNVPVSASSSATSPSAQPNATHANRQREPDGQGLKGTEMAESTSQAAKNESKPEDTKKPSLASPQEKPQPPVVHE